jgi:nucleoid-associated protein YgaU
MTQQATRVTEDLAKSIGTRRAAAEIGGATTKKALAEVAEKNGLKLANKPAAEAAKLLTKELTDKYTAKAASNLASRGIADKIAASMVKSGVSDDALNAIMKAGGKAAPTDIYRYASAATKAGLKPEQIAANLSSMSLGTAKKAATELPIATKLLAAESKNAAVVAAVANPKAAATIAKQVAENQRLIAGSSGALKAGYEAQQKALVEALSANPRTAKLVGQILQGQTVGTFEEVGAGVGANIDAVAGKISKFGEGIGNVAKGAKNVYDAEFTIGGAIDGVASIPTAIGRGIDSAYNGVINTLGKIHFPKFEMPSIDWQAVRNVKIRPMHILAAPVTVPLGVAKGAVTLAIKNPVRFLGVAALTGDVAGAANMGVQLMNRPADGPSTPGTDANYREYELKEGDTLESIAQKELGDANRWQEIYDLNKELFDSLGSDGAIAAGTKIKLPAGGSTPTTNTPAANNGSAAAAYKTALLKLLADKAKDADPDTKQALAALQERLSAMSPEEVYKLKAQLEAKGLVIDSPAANTPGTNTPAGNKPGTNTPAGNKPGTNTPGTNTPGTNTPAGNTPGTNSPGANTPPAPPVAPPANNPAPPPPAPTSYTVQRGDNLWSIAQSQLGDAMKWRDLVGLNKDKYPSLETNPDFIQVGWKLDLPAKGGAKPAAAPASKPAPAANNQAPVNNGQQPTGEQRAQIVKQFGLQQGDDNWNNFWSEVSTYPQSTTGPDTGTADDRKALQQLLGKLGFSVQPTGSYYDLGADGKPKTDAKGNPVSPTADAVIAFKKLAGITQGYNVVGPDGKPAPDVNEYVDSRTREAMQISLRLLQDPKVRAKANMEAAVKEAAKLQDSSIGPECGSREARALAQQYLAGLGYGTVKPTGTFDQATVDALLDFKRKHNLAASYKDDSGAAVYTPYVDGATAEALYQEIAKLQTKK